uniref:L-Fucosyltransferase n=2 Tax=Meloidogyne TaxID=189290 RepID=A0A914MTG2_MELIC
MASNTYRYRLIITWILPIEVTNHLGLDQPSNPNYGTDYRHEITDDLNKMQTMERSSVEMSNRISTSTLTPHPAIIKNNKTLPKFFPKINENTKFLLMQIPHHWNGQCGGLANQIWRFAVLYNMAKSVGRFPGIYNTSTWTCDKLNSPNEIENTFPILYSSLRYMQADPSDSAYDNVFETNCCRYIDVTSIFGNYKQKYLIVPPTPQSPKFLENIDAEIRQLFRFSKQINIRVAAYIDKLFENDQSSHKFCVHTRRGDFGPPKWPMHARTERNFTEAAIKFILGYLKQVNKVYIPKAMNRGEDMCFGVWACDSILLTASSSTYAWWIAYLLEQTDANVFYNSDFNHSYYDKENFPSEWIPLRLDSNLGRIIMD